MFRDERLPPKHFRRETISPPPPRKAPRRPTTIEIPCYFCVPQTPHCFPIAAIDRRAAWEKVSFEGLERTRPAGDCGQRESERSERARGAPWFATITSCQTGISTSGGRGTSSPGSTSPEGKSGGGRVSVFLETRTSGGGVSPADAEKKGARPTGSGTRRDDDGMNLRPGAPSLVDPVFPLPLACVCRVCMCADKVFVLFFFFSSFCFFTQPALPRPLPPSQGPWPEPSGPRSAPRP